ncbi:MAG: hypothetical protein WCZ65_07455 [Lysobacteraceae bacterium]
MIASQWWLRALGRTLIWARLDLHDSGIAQVFDCDGRTLVYDSEDSARAALLDAEFAALDGLDEDDAAALGLDLASIHPPAAGSDEALRERMIQALPAIH